MDDVFTSADIVSAIMVGDNNRAKDDIIESIDELKYYKKIISAYTTRFSHYKITKDNIDAIPTNVLAKSKQYLSPIFFPKKPEIIEEIKGNNTIMYSILTF